MPIFDFVCTNEECKHVIKDLLVPFNQDSMVQCPKCGKEAKKLPSLFGAFKQNWSKWRAMMGN